MRTVGEILNESRNKKNLSLEEAEKVTKIRRKVLQDLEGGNWNHLPPTFIKGLLRNYASFLNLDEKKILAFFRREYDERRVSLIKPPQSQKRRFHFTPKLVSGGLLVAVVLAVSLYLFFQYRSFTAPPLLEIQEPKDGVKISSEEVTVIGRTWNDAILKINGNQVQVSPGGTFSIVVLLKEGVNDLIITSANRFGKLTTVKRTVVVETSKETTFNSHLKTLNLKLLAVDRSVNLKIDVDEKIVFEGLLLAGSVKNINANEKIKIISEDAGATKVIIGDQEIILGKEGERVEREFTP